MSDEDVDTDFDSFGHVSLSELGLSVSDAVSFMKQICMVMPGKGFVRNNDDD